MHTKSSTTMIAKVATKQCRPLGSDHNPRERDRSALRAKITKERGEDRDAADVYLEVYNTGPPPLPEVSSSLRSSERNPRCVLSLVSLCL